MNASDPERTERQEDLPTMSRQADDQISPEDPWVGRSFDGYEIVSLIKRGGQGAVYVARECNPPRDVAIKLIRSIANVHRATRRLEREAVLLGQL